MFRKKLHTRLLAAALLVLVSGKFTACEPEDWMLSIDCGDCYGYAPDSANLIINLTINAENDSVPLTFYRGDYEEGVIDWQDTATTEEFYLYSKMNSNYTVRATYRSGDKIIEAFDADNMELYNANAECGSPCYIVKGGIFDVALPE
ncbi:MAG: hypothetical protein DRI97_07085 [Bacteroidetes bacterium]|nr:MAG: hypothetical protein DRI97_07085 [Bacteroidota bacterium]RLD92563.1 MAG: hypothetical protein DRJ29_11380 [Bacteroidota bacterium]